MPPAHRTAWAEIIAQERADRRAITVWHHGSPGRSVLDTPNPPFRAGRYHLAGGRPTWYGSSTEVGAWQEFVRSLPDGVDASQFQRRIGRVEFELVVLDLASAQLRERLGVSASDLVADDLAVCQTLADLAAEAGFEGVLGPSAALEGVETLAVFGPAIATGATEVVDLGPGSAPS